MKQRPTRNGALALLIAAMAMAGGVPAAAQEPGERPGRSAHERRQGAGPGGSPEEMRGALEQVVKIRLKRVLRLSTEQEARVMPKFEKLLEMRRELAAQRRVARSHLRATMIDLTSGDQAIERALREVEAIETRSRDRERGIREAINAELSPRQRVKLYFFEAKFRQMMQRRMHEAMERRREQADERMDGFDAMED